MTNQEMLNAYNGLKLFQEKEAQIYNRCIECTETTK